jgi:hypothetical protein
VFLGTRKVSPRGNIERARLGVLALLPLVLWSCRDRTGPVSIAGTSGYAAFNSGATAYAPQPAGAVANKVVVLAQAFAANAAGTRLAVLSTPPVATPASGVLVLVQVLTQNTATLAALRDNLGNVYRQVGSLQTYAGTTAGTALYVGAAARGGAAQSWSLVKAAGHEADEATLYVVVLGGAHGIGAWSFSNVVPYGSRLPITTAADGSVVVSFWGPADFSGSATNPDNVYTPPPGWALGGSNPNAFNQNCGAFAWLPVAKAGTLVNPEWSSRKSVQGDGSMWLVEVRR